MHPLYERIMAEPEGICPAEINEYNASMLLGWINNKDSHHTSQECVGSKNCVHAPGGYTYDWALFLLDEMSTICTCETHR